MATAKSKSENEQQQPATEQREPVHHVSHADMANVQVEGGTTGEPNVVMPTGGQIVAAAMNSIALSADDALDIFAADAGKGVEGAKASDYAIPFLIVLQKGSPQVDEASGQSLPNARQGMLFNTVTGEMFDVRPGDKDRTQTPLTFIPCAFRQVWIRWGARKAGGGFKGELTDAQVADMRRKGELKEFEGKLVVPDAQGNINEKCDIVSDHRNHYGLTLTDDGAWQQCVISLTSTQIKKSKNLMAAIGSVKMKNRANGSIFQPPSWANKVAVTTIPESNDKGAWMGIMFGITGRVDRADLYAAGKQFNEAIRAGAVSENYNNLADNIPGGEAEGGGEPSAARPDKF